MAVVPVASQIGARGRPTPPGSPVWLDRGVPQAGARFAGVAVALESDEIVGGAPTPGPRVAVPVPGAAWAAPPRVPPPQVSPPQVSPPGAAPVVPSVAAPVSPPQVSPPGAAPVVPPGARPAIGTGPTATGVASWLNTILPGTCANNAAPMGATITVSNLAGVTVSCTVVSRGPFVAGRIVDLAEPTFAHLASVSQGLVSVTVTW